MYAMAPGLGKPASGRGRAISSNTVRGMWYKLLAADAVRSRWRRTKARDPAVTAALVGVRLVSGRRGRCGRGKPRARQIANTTVTNMVLIAELNVNKRNGLQKRVTFGARGQNERQRKGTPFLFVIGKLQASPLVLSL